VSVLKYIPCIEDAFSMAGSAEEILNAGDMQKANLKTPPIPLGTFSTIGKRQ
jgi:hypothetical protein